MWHSSRTTSGRIEGGSGGPSAPSGRRSIALGRIAESCRAAGESAAVRPTSSSSCRQEPHHTPCCTSPRTRGVVGLYETRRHGIAPSSSDTDCCNSGGGCGIPVSEFRIVLPRPRTYLIARRWRDEPSLLVRGGLAGLHDFLGLRVRSCHGLRRRGPRAMAECPEVEGVSKDSSSPADGNSSVARCGTHDRRNFRSASRASLNHPERSDSRLPRSFLNRFSEC